MHTHTHIHTHTHPLKTRIHFNVRTDRCSISAWDANEGKLVRVFKGHAHWVNTLALSTEGVLRTGAFDHKGNAPSDPAKAQEVALEKCVPRAAAPMLLPRVCV